MRFVYKEIEFAIRFEHHNPLQLRTVKAVRHAIAYEAYGLPEKILQQLGPRKRPLPAFTRCIIGTIVPDPIADFKIKVGQRPQRTLVPFVTGVARLHTGEQYCKSTGRSYAIARALEQIEDLALRDLAWSTYKNCVTQKEGAVR